MPSLELRVPPLALVLAFAIVMAAVAYLIPAARIHIPARTVVALAIAGAGVMVSVVGVVAFRRSRTTVNPLSPEQASSLVVHGIYRFTRNPMYLGFLLALAGWSVHLANLAAALLLPVFVAYMNRFQIQPEERALLQNFGARFAAYTQAVRRWL